MVQKVDLSCNSGIADAELDLLSKLLAKSGYCSLKHLNVGSIGATPTGLATLIKSLHKLRQLNSLDLSNNSFAFFCADALVAYFKATDTMPGSSQPSS